MMNVRKHVRSLVGEKAMSQETAFDMRTYVVSYEKFCKTLEIEHGNPGGDEFYTELCKNNTNLKRMFAKKKGKEVLFSELMDLYKKQYTHYESSLEENIIIEASERYKSSEAMIVIEKEKYRNVVGYKENGILKPDEFLITITNGWSNFMHNYEAFIEIILSNLFYGDAEYYEKIVSEEREFYFRVKRNKSELRFDTKNQNGYKNIYVYARNQYLLNFYKTELPDMDFFTEIKQYEYCMKKDSYTLRDVAEIYQYMIGSEKDQYENMKKVFQGNQYIEKFKEENNRYCVTKEELSEIIVAYMFFKRKNNRESDYDEWELDEIIRKIYARLLDLLIRRDTKRKVFLESIFEFYKDEFEDLFSVLNTNYQDTMLTYLMEGMERIFARSIGAEKKTVYE